MTLVVSLHEPASSAHVGNKFINLARTATQFRVPSALCVTVDAFRLALGPERLAFAQEFFADLRATVGCFLLQSMPSLEAAMEGLTLPHELRTSLRDQLTQTFGSLDGRAFAVRSSGVAEDSGSFSFAGVYTSLLNVRGFDQLCDAIVECWQVYYSYPAVAARVRANQYSPEPEMGLIIQEMIAPLYAGVAFTSAHDDERVVAEFVRGLGDKLVSGVANAQRYVSGEPLPEQDQALAPMLDEVCRTVESIKAVYGHEVDVEWAWDERGLHILQVRPVTIALQAEESSDPFFRSAALYADAALPQDLTLGEIRDVYITYVTKRAPAYRLAAECGVATGAAHVVSFNGAGLLHEQDALAEALASPAPRAVVDLNTNLRQVMVDKRDLVQYLKNTFQLTPTSAARHTAIIRDFIRGEYGFISRLIGEYGLLIECSEEGLLSINRGIGHSARIVIEDVREPLIAEAITGDASDEVIAAFLPVIPIILQFTQRLNQAMPRTQLEWVLEQGTPYFVDFSREDGSIVHAHQSGTIVIAPGVTRGPIICLNDDDLLYRLSVGPAVSVNKNHEVLDHDGLRALVELVAAQPERPIIYARHPYAVLSVLFEHSAGFIFNQGTILCHLAILLREAGLPAVISRTLTVQNGDVAVIADGQVDIFRQESQR
jgi:hypothetical protein